MRDKRIPGYGDVVDPRRQNLGIGTLNPSQVDPVALNSLDHGLILLCKLSSGNQKRLFDSPGLADYIRGYDNGRKEI